MMIFDEEWCVLVKNGVQITTTFILENNRDIKLDIFKGIAENLEQSRYLLLSKSFTHEKFHSFLIRSFSI